MSANKNEKDSLNNQLNQIKNLHNSNIPSPEQYLVNGEEDMPGFGELELYDYQKDKDDSYQEAKKIITSLVSLYLADSKEVSEHEYIKLRMEEDAEYYGQMKFLQSISEKVLLEQMKQLQTGNFNPRLLDSLIKQQAEYRSNIQDGRNARSEVEKLYKNLRKDLNLSENTSIGKLEENEEEDGIMMNNTRMNEDIEKFLRNRDE